MTTEAKIILEAAIAALEAPNPDTEAIREMLKEADELLAQASNEQASAD
ncbi:MAG: hypothetical protein HC850_02410 [Rhodomicrobium sp.]|nr:hypothetical protein [Rhodomicrobium sp.]